MKIEGFVVQRLETDRDIEQYSVLMRKVFGEEVGVDKLAKKLIDYHPTMTLKDFFIIKHKRRIVSTINLIPVKWSIGGIPLKVAEMGMVATLPENRREGLIRGLVDEFHKEVKDQAYDLAVIEGIPYFYRQFGYEYAIPLLEETRIRLDQIPEGKSKIRIRSFAQKDIPKAMKLLEQSQRKFYVHSVRNGAVWRMQEKTGIASDPEPFQAFAVEEEEKLIAYFRVRENRKEKELILTEITDVDQLVAQAILSFLRNFGVERGVETLSARISYEEALTEQLIALGAIRRIPTYAWQVRITDHLKIFEKLTPLFESRLAASMYRRLTETLSFNFRSFTVQMEVREGKIARIQKIDTGERSPIGLNPSVFVQLLMGYRSRQELETTFPDVRIDVGHKHLIDTLFPKLPSYIHSAY